LDFKDYKGVWVFIEQKDGVVASVSLELLGAGRKLADKRGVELAGILIGENVKQLTKTVFEYGADTVYVYDQPIFKHYRT
jgi:electron transfer flavoprotein alpha subunit